ncbi:MAG: TetR/AcrR family transcriptional regulator [Caldilineales bacterium]|nr:TetR/AcrR family transcriptional regulator [Caldilineales bacterium]MCW5857105.1 TetR/AcrR family transcriptional regulator [Caldilineales bacterium]
MQQRQRSQTTRSQLLDAALTSFAARGYAAASVDDICQAAGVSKGAFYHHFSSKQALFLALLDRWLEAFDRQAAMLQGQDLTVGATLTELAELAAPLFRDAAGQLPMFLEFWSQAARDPAVWAATIAPFARYRQFFAGLVAAGVANGDLKLVNTDAAARAVLALALGLLLQSVLEPTADWDRITREAVQIALRGLLQNPDGE